MVDRNTEFDFKLKDPFEMNKTIADFPERKRAHPKISYRLNISLAINDKIRWTMHKISAAKSF